MGMIKTKGIVTKVSNYSDSDKILTIITADHGKIKAIYKGAKKSKGGALATSEFLAFSDFVLYDSTGDMYKVASSEIIEVFYNLRMDVEKLFYATTISQIMNDVCVEEEVCLRKLQLLLNTLFALSETDKPLDFIYAIFQIRLLGLLGFVPILRKVCFVWSKCY